MNMTFKTTKEYLDYYTKDGIKVEVVYHPHSRIGWGRNRKWYDGIMDCEYNHRSILNHEVVFDFDAPTKNENWINVVSVLKVFDNQKINYSLWSTGGDGYHIHTFWDGLEQISRLGVMKKTILKMYGGGKHIDYQLAGKHLIRTEWGLYEKLCPLREVHKTLIIDKKGLSPNELPSFLFKTYVRNIKKDFEKDLKKIEGVKGNDDRLNALMSGELKVRDGKERVMFYLIHKLKELHDYDDVVKKITSWYHYNGGFKMTKSQIKSKVAYHWRKKYSFSASYLDDFIK